MQKPIKPRISPKLIFAEALTSPKKLFGFWQKEEMLSQWEQLLKPEDRNGYEFHLRLALNNPQYVLKSWTRWYLANVTDNEHQVIIPVDDFDSWLKSNGFTGKVDKNYIQSGDEYKARKSERNAKRQERARRIALAEAWRRQDTGTVRKLFASIWK